MTHSGIHISGTSTTYAGVHCTLMWTYVITDAYMHCVSKHIE